MKDPTEELTGIYFSLWLWDISHALNMTSFLFYVILNDSEESHRITDGHILFTLVVGYFADAQYDVKTQVEYFAYLNMTMFFILRHPGNAERANLLARVCERRYS